MIVIRSAECCALVLVGCGMPPALEGLEAPVVVRGEFREGPTPAEAVVLVHRILQRESDELLLDTGKRHAFARNIQTILSRIRNTHPRRRTWRCGNLMRSGSSFLVWSQIY